IEMLNIKRKEIGEPTVAIPRNFASGTIKLLYPIEVAKRPLDCFLYFLYANQRDLIFDSHWDSIQAVKSWGFPICEHTKLCQNIEEILAFINFWEEMRHQLTYDIDGIVIKDRKSVV